MDIEKLSELLFNLGSPHGYFVQWAFETVYHYTDLEALIGIVTSQDLWLSDSRYSNDTEEMNHGLAVTDGVITAQLDGRVSDKKRAFLEGVKERIDKSRDEGVYICCFCLEDDLLSQWRGYGANGTGVSIGLESGGFEVVAGPDLPPTTFGLMYLWKVFYDEERQQALIEACLDHAWNPRGDLHESIDLATDALRFFIPIFKHSAFKDEKEARLVFIPSADCPVPPSFRVARGMLLPYYSLKALSDASLQHQWRHRRPQWRLPVKTVRVGPSPLVTPNRKSVELLLVRCGFRGAQVLESSAPYRG